MNDVALIIIYNHRFDKNVDIIESIYKKRFKNIYHLMPFYDGNKKNVIPVYGNSYYFQGYIAQGYLSFYNSNYKHYIFIGDDLLLNPLINEYNYTEFFKINDTRCFIPGFINFHDIKNVQWDRVLDAYYYNPDVKGVEIKTLLPSYKKAIEKLQRHNIHIKPLRYTQVYKRPPKITKYYQIRLLIKHIIWYLKYIKYKNKTYNLNYPVIGSYSDIFVISAKSIKEFSFYCGIFSATNLFVEVGLPTALALSSEKIITEKELNYKGRALWTKDDFKILDKYENNLNKLLNDFPSNYLYLHPIKLSKWNIHL